MSVKGLLVPIALAALALPAVVPAEPAVAPDRPLAHSLDGLLADGWKIVAPDVLERRNADGSVQTLAFGLSAREVEIRQLRGQLGALERLAAVNPSPDLAEQIASRRALLAELESEPAPERPALGEKSLRRMSAALGCDLDLHYSCSAGPGFLGPSGSASASFTDTCNHWGEAYATAYAEGDLGTNFRFGGQVDGPTDGFGSASASASAFVSADNNCYSDAYARLRVEDDLGSIATYTCFDDNTQCRPTPPPTPPTATITSCEWEQFSGSECAGFCYGTASGGTPPYSTSWTVDGMHLLQADPFTAWASCSMGENVLFEVEDSAGGYDSDTWPCCAF